MFRRGRIARGAMGVLAAILATTPVWGATKTQLESVAQSVLDMAISQGFQGASVGLSYANGTTWAGSSGYSDIARTTAIQPTDEYRVGSFSKTLTGTVVLQLVDQGAVKLTDTVSQWLPSANIANGDKITIGELLSMTSGIPEYLSAPSLHVAGETILDEWNNFSSPSGPYGYASYTPAELIAQAEKKTAGQIGTMSYSNTNFTILGLIAETASCATATGCQSIETMVNALTKKLGLTTITFPTDSSFTGPYVQNGQVSNGVTYNMSAANPMVPWASGAVIGTPAELAALGRELALNTQGTLSTATWTERWTDTSVGEVGGLYVKYGLAGYIMPSPGTGGYVYGHSGQIAGYTTSIFYDPAIDIAISVLYSGSGSDSAAPWYPLYGFESYLGSSVRDGYFNALSIYWAIDRNLTVASMAAGSCNWDSVSGFGAGKSGSCSGVNARLTSLTLDNATLTVNPSGEVIGNLVFNASTSWYDTVETAAPSISFFGSSLNGIAMTGGSRLNVLSGAIVEMTGVGSSAIASSGEGNQIVIGGSVLAYGNGTVAIRGGSGAETVIIASTATVLGDISLGTGADRLRIDGAVAGNVPLGADARLEGTGTIVGTIAGGTIVPGDDGVGTLTVATYTASTSTLGIDVAANGATNRLAVTGTAALNGGHLTVAANAAAPDTWSTILTADTLSGNFASVSSTAKSTMVIQTTDNTILLGIANPMLIDAGIQIGRRSMAAAGDAIDRQALSAADGSNGTSGIRFWSDAKLASVHVDANAAERMQSATGFDLAAGAEMPLTDWFKAGLSFAFGTGKTSSDYLLARTTTFMGGIYGAFDLGALTVAAQINAGRGSVKTERTVVVDGTRMIAKADMPDTRLGARLSAARGFDIGGAILEPRISVSYFDMFSETTRETGANAANLQMKGTSTAFVRTEGRLTLRGALPVDELGIDARIDGEVHAGLANDIAVGKTFLDVTPAGTTITTRLHSAEKRVLAFPVGVRIGTDLGGGAAAFLSYDGAISTTTREHRLGLNVHLKL